MSSFRFFSIVHSNVWDDCKQFWKQLSGDRMSSWAPNICDVCQHYNSKTETHPQSDGQGTFCSDKCQLLDWSLHYLLHKNWFLVPLQFSLTHAFCVYWIALNHCLYVNMSVWINCEMTFDHIASILHVFMDEQGATALWLLPFSGISTEKFFLQGTIECVDYRNGVWWNMCNIACTSQDPVSGNDHYHNNISNVF